MSIPLEMQALGHGLLIIDTGEGWEVWCGVDGSNIINAHILGSGKTRGEAVNDALEEWDRISDALCAISDTYR